MHYLVINKTCANQKGVLKLLTNSGQGGNGGTGYIPHKEQIKFEDPFQKAINQQMKMLYEPYQSTSEFWRRSQQ